jgi:lactate permease
VPALLASLPLAIVLFGMLAWRWSAARAGAAGLAIALILALLVFGPAPDPATETATALGGALLEALHSTGVILWIILPALSLYEMQRRSGAIERIRDTLTALAEERALQVLLIAWFFGLFIEGAAGFGTPVALAAPLLVGLGYPPVRAVALALVGHAAGVSFGAVGTPVLTQAEISGLPGDEIAWRTALIHAALGIILVLALVRLASDDRLRPGLLLWTFGAAAAFLLPSVLLAALVGPELPTLGGALIGGALFACLLWWRSPGRIRPGRTLLADLATYLIVLGLVLVTRLVPQIQALLQSATFAWGIGETYSGSFQPLYHPGTLLFLGLVAGALATGRSRLVLPSVIAAIGRLLPVALALLVMLALSRLMVHSGMISTLAEAAAQTGPAWPLIAPAIGVLGTFVTGSATASNILFTEFQLETAAALGLPAAAMAAIQSVGAAIGNVAAPHNIIAGSATVGLTAREGEILARTAAICLIYTAAGGILLSAVLAVLG